MSIFDELGVYFFRRKMKKTRPVKGDMNGKVFISRQSWHFFYVNSMIKVLSLICTLTWRVNNYVSHQEKGLNKRNESTIDIIKNYEFDTVEVLFITFHF